jgi:hypothetical protein
MLDLPRFHAVSVLINSIEMANGIILLRQLETLIPIDINCWLVFSRSCMELQSRGYYL